MTAPIRPQHEIQPVPENHLRSVLEAYKVTELVAVVGIRGYVKQFAQATAGGNLIGVYDDAICLVTPQECVTFLGNTDPSRTIDGRAILQAGYRYRYTRGIHGITGPKERQRPAWVQAGPVVIRRYKNGVLGPIIEGQYIGCNIHNGSWTTTGSAACQTIVPERWKAFDSKLEAALKAVAQTQFWYILTV